MLITETFALCILLVCSLCILFILIFDILFFFYSIQSTFIGIPTLKTKFKDLNFLLENEKINSTDIVYDLGSGLGQTIFYIETKTSAATFGFEMNLISFVYSWMLCTLQDYRTKLYFKNFLSIDFSPATVIYTYLGKSAMKELEPVFEKHLTPSTRLISCDFPLPIREPIRKHIGSRHTFYIYQY